MLVARELNRKHSLCELVRLRDQQLRKEIEIALIKIESRYTQASREKPETGVRSTILRFSIINASELWHAVQLYSRLMNASAGRGNLIDA
jgi:hypothetical protein